MKKDLLKFPFKRTFFSTVILCSLSVIFNSCNDDGEGRIKLNDKAPAKVTNVTTESGPGIDVPQVYRINSNPVARYIKVYFGTEHKGTGAQAMVSEINVYGAE